MKTTNKIHYVYKITNLNPTDERLYYIGVRSTSKSSPELDTNYRSSSKYLKEAIKEIGHDSFKKEILSIWNSRKLAVQEEIRLHEKYDVAKNPLFYNKAKQTSTGFDRNNAISVFDTITNKTYSVSKEVFDTSKHLVGVGKNTVASKNIITGEVKRIPKEIFDIDKNWVSANLENTKRGKEVNTAKKIQIFDLLHNLRFECEGNFHKICNDNNLPLTALGNSYRNDGFPIYQNQPNSVIGKLKTLDKYKFKGWYAKIS